MTLTAQTAALRIRRELREAEARCDDALLAHTRLMESMVAARQSQGTEVHTGQRALIRLARAIQMQVDAASDLFRVHDEMTRIGQEMGILDEGTANSQLADDDIALGVARAA